jgi:hypothetical protein
MSAGETPHRQRGRSLREWLMLCEAGVLLIAARVTIKTVPTAQIVRWVRRPLRQGSPTEALVDMERLRWAVTAFSRKAPIRLVCFPQALAMHAMLRRRGIASEILYGAARLGDGKLATHAWLRMGERVWVGGEVSPDFTVLDIWTPRAQRVDVAGRPN